jgi:hypothetical protein
MNYAIMIAAAFLIATIAIAALSPFEDLPRPAPQEATLTNEPPPPPVEYDEGAYDDSSDYAESERYEESEESYDDESSYSDGESYDEPDWPEGEEPPE